MDQPLLRVHSAVPDSDSWRKFFAVQTGRTNGAHQSVVRTFKSLGLKEAESIQDADFCLLFCPVTSRVGTDVSEAMEHLPHGKGAVLVVMHHTFDPEQVIPPSRRLVTDRRVRLTLDCLFYENSLLRCRFNNDMESEIRTFFRSSRPEVKSIPGALVSILTCPVSIWVRLQRLLGSSFSCIICFLVIIVIIVLMVVFIHWMNIEGTNKTAAHLPLNQTPSPYE
ncbi:unnamed protein product [Ophioblennius macclurei]